jgi:hypothetical protein
LIPFRLHVFAITFFFCHFLNATYLTPKTCCQTYNNFFRSQLFNGVHMSDGFCHFTLLQIISAIKSSITRLNKMTLYAAIPFHFCKPTPMALKFHLELCVMNDFFKLTVPIQMRTSLPPQRVARLNLLAKPTFSRNFCGDTII